MTLLGIATPIVQAPMAGSQGAALAIAVANAGGLGSIAGAMYSPDALAAELATTRAGTRGPINVNFFCHAAPTPDAERLARWRALLAPYYNELGIDDAVVAGPTREPFGHDAADVVETVRPEVVSFHFGLPAPALLDRVRGWGAKILSSATTVAEARWLAARGVDAIIAQGLEAGGHRGMFLTDDVTTQIGTLALVPQIIAATGLPVIAAGGIADAAGVAAVLALGATYAQLGTAFLLCPEATTSAVHRAALRSDAAVHTALTNLFSGRPARGIVNRLMRELGPLHPLAPAFPLATAPLAPLRAAAERANQGDFSPLWAGQNATGCRAVPAAAFMKGLTPEG